jgi:predicted ATPase
VNASTLLFALSITSFGSILWGNYAMATAVLDELVAFADQKGALFWKASGIMGQGNVLSLTGNAADAVQRIPFGLAAWRSTGATLLLPLFLSSLGRAYAGLGQFDDAWRCIGEATTAIETSKEAWFEAEVHRIAGEIALKSPEPDAAKARAYFDHALAVARAQHAKSWELCAAMRHGAALARSGQTG